MSDAELATKISEAGGRVFIGFKDSAATAGVDESGRVLVNSPSMAIAKSNLRSLGLDFEIEFITTPAVVTRIPAALVAELRRNPRIEYIEPIFPMQAMSQDTTWNILRVGAPSAWSYSTGAGAKVLIIDTGIDNHQPDLEPAVIQSCESPPGTGLDLDGHGTNTAGVLAAVDNDIQVVGVAHGVALWSSKASIGATKQIDPGYAACAVQFGRVNEVQVINMSWGTTTPYTALTDQINGAYGNGIVLVASAGNAAGGAVSYPATLDAVIAVSATDASDSLADFSSVGSKVELASPGQSVETTCFFQESCLVSGTSIASPHVAAAAAILKMYNPLWSNIEIRRRLGVGATDLGTSGRDPKFGYGMLNIVAAINAPPALLVSISGTPTIHVAGNYSWTCSASGGVGGFSYLWERSDDNGPYYQVGTDVTYASWVDSSNDPTIDLRCSVTSGTQTVPALKHVAVAIPQ